MNRNSIVSESWVIKLIIINVVIFFIQTLTVTYQVKYIYSSAGPAVQYSIVEFYGGLTPALVASKGYVWQIFTYMFLHGGFFHIFLNMYALLIFGISIEQVWGSKKFLLYYLFTGVGAGLTIFLLNYFMRGTGFFVPTIGASGAVFGLLLAFGILFPNAQILLFFIIPIRAKYLVILYGGFELYSLIQSGGAGSISHIGHLGGLLFGIIYFVIMRKRSIEFKSKKIRSEISKDIREHESKKIFHNNKAQETLLNILKKSRAGGFNSLSDDEVQFYNYQRIMYDDYSGKICDEEDFNSDDEHCLKCEHIEACIIREIKKLRR